jgi:hypothetical protein
MIKETLIAATLMFGNSASAHTRLHPKDNCPYFAHNLIQYGRETGTYNAREIIHELHSWGCHNPNGDWVKGTSRCDRIAYRLESQDRFSLVRVGRHRCVIFDDGSWADE